MNDSDYPALYRSADALSICSQAKFFRGLFWHLVLLAVATLVSVVNSPKPCWAIFQAGVLLAALGCAIYLFSARPDRTWYAARAVAESIKTMTWRYISKAEPFDGSDAASRDLFRQKLTSVVEQNIEVAKQFTRNLNDQQVTSEMLAVRGKSLQERLDNYVNHRIDEQHRWYAGKAQKSEAYVARIFISLLVAIAIAIGLSLLKIRFPSASFWPTDLFVTVSASLLGWMQARRYQEISASYALAAHEISLIRDQAHRIKSEASFSLFVGDAENAFSREHTQWVARQDR